MTAVGQPSKRYETAVHEAAHALISFAFGVDFMYIIMWDDENAEVIPECGSRPCCVHYYEKNNPSNDAHARSIQDQIRKDVAISVGIVIGTDGVPQGPVTIFP